MVSAENYNLQNINKDTKNNYIKKFKAKFKDSNKRKKN